MKAPVMPSSVMLLAVSFLLPIWTTAVPKSRMPASRASLRILVRIDVVDVDLGRQIRVLIQQVLAFAEARALVEIGDGRVLLQSLDDLARSARRGCSACSRSRRRTCCSGWPGRCTTTDRGNDHQDVDRRVRRIFGLSRFSH